MVCLRTSQKLSAFLVGLIVVVSLFMESNCNNGGNAFAQFEQNQIPTVNYYANFYNLNMPATILVGQNVTLTGTINVNALQYLDHLYLTINIPGQVYVYGSKSIDLGSVPSGVQQKNFSFKFIVLQPGQVQIFLSVAGVQQQSNIFFSGSTTINSTSVPALNLTQSSSQLAFSNISVPSGKVRGQEIDIPYTFYNKGSSVADDVFISAQAPTGLLVSGQTIDYVGTFKPGQQYSSDFKFVPIEAGSFNVVLTAYSSNNPPTSLPVTITVGDSNTEVTITNVGTTPVNLFPGDIGDMINIGLTNYGNQALNGTVVRLLTPQGISIAWSGYDKVVLPFLPSAKDFPSIAQQYVTFYVNVDQNLNPGTYHLGVSINSTTNNPYYLDAPIAIQPKAAFEVESISYSDTNLVGMTENLDSVSPGKIIIAKITLKNIGTAPAEDLVAQLQTSNDLQGIQGDITNGVNINNVGTTTGNVDVPGTILPGEVFHSTFLLNPDNTIKPGTRIGTVYFTWKQGILTGDFTQGVKFPIVVSSEPLIYQIPFVQIFLGLTSALFVILYFKGRKKQKSTIEEK